MNGSNVERQTELAFQMDGLQVNICDLEHAIDILEAKLSPYRSPSEPQTSAPDKNGIVQVAAPMSKFACDMSEKNDRLHSAVLRIRNILSTLEI